MFFLLYFYFLIKLVKMYRNAFYQIIPPTVEDVNITTNAFYEVTPPTPPYEVIPTSPLPFIEYTPEQIQEIRMQASIERFASFDDSMEIPGLEGYLKEDEEEDDQTIRYDDEVYRFHKCGEIDGCYDYSELYELETLVPEHDDYFLPENEYLGGEYMDMDDDDMEDINYYNDPDYWREMRIEQMMDRFQDRE